jgi:tetratricopeptide (TPR) repeat protein
MEDLGNMFSIARPWRTHWLRRLATIVILQWSAGCVPQSTLPVVSNQASPPVKSADNDKDLPRRQPQASTCVAFGDFNARAAADKERQPIHRERLLDQARRAYQQALKEDPKCREAYVGLARTYEQLGDHHRAVETYERAANTFPQDAAFRFALGMCQARAKEWEPALANLKGAVDLDPENRTYENMLAYTLARAGRYDDSLECFKSFVGVAEAHYNVARMLLHVNETEQCKQHLRCALEAKADFAPARQLLVELDHPGQKANKPIVAVGFEAADDLPAVPPAFHPGGE